MPNIKTKQEYRQEFRDFFNKEVKPFLLEYEESRKKDRITVYSYIAFVIGIILIPFNLIFAVISFILFFFLFNNIDKKDSGSINSDYEMKLKTLFMPKLLSIFGDFSWNKYYSQDYKKDYDMFKDLKIFPKTYTLGIDDIIKGSFNNVGIEIIEVKTGFYANYIWILLFVLIFSFVIFIMLMTIIVVLFLIFSNITMLLNVLKVLCISLFIIINFFILKNAIMNQSFKGVLIRYTFPKKIEKHTFLFENALSSKKLFFKGQNDYEKVTLEDAGFNKKYTVLSKDQVTSRYLLTTSFMERFKNIKTAFKSDFQRAEFKDNKLNILISVKKDLFKLGNINEESSYTNFVELFEEFYSIISLIEQLKLDQKIGL